MTITPVTDIVFQMLMIIGTIFLFLIICAFCSGSDSKSKPKRNTRTYTNKNTNRSKNNRNYRGGGAYDPGEYYSEWGDDGGYE